jgi:hypothetical protein
MFGIVRKKIARVIKIDYHEVIQRVFMDPEIQHEMIRLNTRDQLFDKGENSLGVRLETIGGEYSFVTILRKNREGLPSDHITLFQEGKFYASFEVVANRGDDFIIIKADSMKNGVDILERWGIEVLGLNKENTKWLVNEIRKKIIKEFRSALRAAA